MPVNVFTNEDGKAFCKTEDGSVVNIRISQRSFWDGLADYVTTMKRIQSEGESSTKEDTTALLDVSMLPLGVICIAISAFTTSADVYMYDVYYTGALFWMGVPYIASALVEIVVRRNNHSFRVFLAFFFQLLSFAVSVTGIMVAAEAMIPVGYWLDNGCEFLANFQSDSNQYSNYQNSYQYTSYKSSGLKQAATNCQQAVQRAKNLQNGLLIVLLIIASWGMISSTIAVVSRLNSLCKLCHSRKELGDTEPLVKSPPYTVTV